MKPDPFLAYSWIQPLMSYRTKKAPYTVVSNLLANSTLSLQCVGMLVYLLSKPSNWKGHNFDIQKRGKFGDKMRRKLTKEAEDAGWLKFCVEHRDGRLNCYYEVQIEPLPPEARTNSRLHGKNTTPPLEGGLYNPPSEKGVVDNGVVRKGVLGGEVIINKELPIKELEIKEVEAASAEIWEDFKTRASLTDDQLEMIREGYHSVPGSLVLAALDCWLEPSGSKKRWAEESPVRFLRGVLGHPGAFGVKQVGSTFTYGNKNAKYTPKLRAIVDRAKRQIVQMRADDWRTDRTIAGELAITFTTDQLQQAFKELDHEHAGTRAGEGHGDSSGLWG